MAGIIASVLAALNQYNGGAKPLAWPKPASVKSYPTVGVTNQNDTSSVPDLAAADGTIWQITSSQIQRVGPTGTVIYTIVPSVDVNASATQFVGFCVDYAAGRLYMLADNGGTTQWLAYTTLAAKAMTVRASTTNTMANRPAFIERVSGGDFFVASSNANQTTPLMEFAAITEASGAISAASPLRTGGVNPMAGIAGMGGVYITQDRSIVMDFRCDSSTLPVFMRLNRGGGYGPLSLGATNYGFLPASGGTSMGAVVNGDFVTLLGMTAIGLRWWFMPRHFLRSDFDAFLQRACDFAGLPK